MYNIILISIISLMIYNRKTGPRLLYLPHIVHCLPQNVTLKVKDLGYRCQQNSYI